jgi:CubicO group peptidase (beta-lactamase class C family)
LTQPRSQLTAEQLTVEQTPGADTLALLDMSHFSRPEWALEATHRFSGSVSFTETELTFPIEREPYSGEKVFPGFTIDFVSHEGELIPVGKDIISTRHQSTSFWDVIVGAGEVWHEEADGAWSRASFPLTLTDRYMGQARNCVATFVYKPAEISDVYVQCSQETADITADQVGNMRVMLEAEYHPTSSPDFEKVVEDHDDHRHERLPVFPIDRVDTTNSVGPLFGAVRRTNAPTSVGAVVIDDTVYRHPPDTRHGRYPYPREMRHGVYSVTKSMAGALSLLYFAERYGAEIFDEPITDYVPALAGHPGWQGVTFGHTLNMVTGVEAGEGADHLLNILVLARGSEEAIQNIATLGDYPGGPGEQFNYASTNFFVLSYALQNYVQRNEGEEVYYWDLVRENVLAPIGAEDFALLHTVEADSSQGLPILAYGALPTLDEAAKIALLFSKAGSHNGQQLLHREKTREALGRTAWAGYSTGDDDRGMRYRHSFWSTTVRTSECNVKVTYMLGYGGNYVLFLPSGAVVIRFMDEHEYDLSTLVQRVEALKSSCP